MRRPAPATVRLAALLLLLLPGLARAEWDTYLAVGPSGGLVAGSTMATAPLASLDLTVAWLSSRPSRSMAPNLGLGVWGSVGARVVIADDPAYLPYVEAGVWYLVNVGAGYSYAAGTGALGRHHAHLFVGVPIPPLARWFPFLVEPYYRPTIGREVFHEVGVLVKFPLKLGARD